MNVAASHQLAQRLSPTAVGYLLEDSEGLIREAVERRPGQASSLGRDADIDVLMAALAEVEAAHPGTADGLAILCDELSEAGLTDTLLAVGADPALAQAMRLSIEVYSRVFFSPREILRALEERSEKGNLPLLAQNIYVASRILVGWLREQLH